MPLSKDKTPDGRPGYITQYWYSIDNLKKLIEVFGEEPSRALLSYMAPYTIEKRLKIIS